MCFLVHSPLSLILFSTDQFIPVLFTNSCAGAFSDDKYNITNDFGGTLFEYISKKPSWELMHYVNAINLKYVGEGTNQHKKLRITDVTRSLAFSIYC